MTQTWISQTLWCLEQQQEIVLVTVAEVKGSAPREPSAKMIIAADQQWLTIGGGNLEWQAAIAAREYLSSLKDKADAFPHRWFQTFQLGPSLGQCCGGVVILAFEHLVKADVSWLQQLKNGLDQGQIMSRKIQLNAVTTNSQQLNADVIIAGPDSLKGVTAPACYFSQENGVSQFFELVAPDYLNVFVFGAGHVGKALIHILGTLALNVIWVDSRSDLFPNAVPNNVQIEDTDIPEEVIRTAPADSCFIIMTHDHALDQKLCEQLLQRDDFRYFGLIGSNTKRNKFEHRFKARGIDAKKYERMICPIGDPKIQGKQPAVIALAIASQLMQLSDNEEA